MTTNMIIVGYDRSADARAAAAWALDEAARTGALVEFFYAYEWPLWMPAASMVPGPAVWPDGATDQALHSMLDEAVASARHTHPGVRTAASIVHAPAAVTLIERSAEASLVVVGSQGHSGVTSLLGSVSVAVSAHARCPVVVVRGDPDPAGPVVVGFRDPESDRPVLSFAIAEAAARDAELQVIRAWPATVAAPGQRRPAVTETGLDEETRRLDDLLAEWRDRYPQVKVTTQVLPEHPAAALARAGSTAAMIVVGTRGRGALRGMVLGSVSQHLLHHATCTVVVVHGAAA